MRSIPRLGLAAIAVVLVLCGLYTAFWFIAADRIEAGIGQWAQSLRAQHLELTWRALQVSGFPFVMRVALTDAHLHDDGATPGEAETSLLLGRARPWLLRVWRIEAPGGLSGTRGPADHPKWTAKAARLDGSVAVNSQGGARVWLGLAGPGLVSGPHLAAEHADVWLNLPAHPPQNHSGRAAGVALLLHQVTLPAAPAPFRNPLDEVSFGLTVKGVVPSAPLRQAAAAWRDEGGTIELDHLTLRWNSLRITGSGTLALDADLQPIGGFAGAIEGYQELMAGLVAAGRLPENDARLAGLGLALLSRRGPDGRSQISTSFTIQNGQMFLGPAKLGPAPRIAWH